VVVAAAEANEKKEEKEGDEVKRQEETLALT